MFLVTLLHQNMNLKLLFMKKTIIKTVLTAIVGLGISSCKGYFYQVYEVNSNDSKLQDNSLVYENEDCMVLYNLWSYNGELKFAIMNKTEKDIFINMGQSFYVVNGLAVDYYQGRTFTSQSSTQAAYLISSTSGTGKGTGIWNNDIYTENLQTIINTMNDKFVKTASSSVSIEEKEIVCIPAKCYKIFNYYSVNPTLLTTCFKDRDYPKKSYNVGDYTLESSPMVFKNRIAYGFTKNDVADKHIDNNFWISSITNYSNKEAVESQKSESECYGIKSSSKYKVFKIGGPNKFYKLYKYHF